MLIIWPTPFLGWTLIGATTPDKPGWCVLGFVKMRHSEFGHYLVEEQWAAFL